jgi:hypothetical protein
MRTVPGVDAATREAETLDRTAVEQVLLHNLLRVPGQDEPVPDGLRINDHDGAVLALVEAACAVDAHGAFEPGGLHSVFQGIAQLLAASVGAAGPGRGFIALVLADKEVVLVAGHRAIGCRGAAEVAQGADENTHSGAASARMDVYGV